MIRTRDLIVFLTALVFILLGITLTLFDDVRIAATVPLVSEEAEGEGETYTVTGDVSALDRRSIIEHLRSAIAGSEGEVEPVPSVEESDMSVSDTDVAADTSGISYCDTFDDSTTIARSWPQKGVTLVQEGNMRKAVHSAESHLPVAASSTASTSSMVRTLLVVPLSPLVQSESCVPGEVIGVSTSGALLYNKEAALYRGYGGEYLIGYARDGFPLYGYYDGQTDACGGYEHASGYRYVVRPAQEHVLSCYRGTPSAFTGF